MQSKSSKDLNISLLRFEYDPAYSGYSNGKFTTGSNIKASLCHVTYGNFPLQKPK